MRWRILNTVKWIKLYLREPLKALNNSSVSQISSLASPPASYEHLTSPRNTEGACFSNSTQLNSSTGSYLKRSDTIILNLHTVASVYRNVNAFTPRRWGYSKHCAQRLAETQEGLHLQVNRHFLRRGKSCDLSYKESEEHKLRLI